MSVKQGNDVVPFVDLRKQYDSIASDVKEAILGVISRCDFILGEGVATLEENFARFLGVQHAVGVGNGLDALRLALAAHDVGADDEVILPANTFIATALAVSAVGARPVLVDCDPNTYNMDVSKIEAAITPRTKALLPVHLTGQAAEMDPILEIAGRHNLPVIEDAAQAHGTDYRGRRCGSLGSAGCFSFYPGKNLGGCGDGGMVATNDEQLAARIARFRNYGQEVKYTHLEKGTNSRLDTIQAVVLNVKLARLEQWNAARASHAKEYARQLEGVGDIQLQQVSPDSTHVYHLFIIQTEQRDALQQHLSECGIQTGIHYPIPIHLQKAYAELGHREGDFPVTENLARRMLSLPMFPELTSEQIRRVADSVSRYFDS